MRTGEAEIRARLDEARAWNNPTAAKLALYQLRHVRARAREAETKSRRRAAKARGQSS